MAKIRTVKKPETTKDKPESLLSLIKAGIQMVLMIVGIIGAATYIFSDNGLLARLGGKLTRMDSFGSLLAIPLILVALYVGRIWFEKTFARSSSAAIANLAMYAVMAIGAYYLYLFLTTGSFTG